MKIRVDSGDQKLDRYLEDRMVTVCVFLGIIGGGLCVRYFLPLMTIAIVAGISILIEAGRIAWYFLRKDRNRET